MDDDARRAWSKHRTPGQPAVFESGEELRCPASYESGFGQTRTCGQTLRIWAKSRMVVRPRQRGSAGVIGGSEYHCRACHHWSDVYAIRDEVRLEATG